ncbi:MAG: hypothetical protein RJA07_2366 [Bacteroidota bacterium]|jgi:hypothetical protein
MAKIIFKRPNEYFNFFRNYALMIDSKKVGEIHRGEEKSINISPGLHEVYAKVDWGRSKKISINVADNKSIYLKVTSMKYCNLLGQLVLISFFVYIVLQLIFGFKYAELVFAPTGLYTIYYILFKYNEYLIIKEM